MKIIHARFSESGTAIGRPGDQTGNEVSITDWYNGSWTQVYRPTDMKQAQLIRDFCRAAADNEHIGYSQDARTGLYVATECATVSPVKVTEDCCCDCSSLVAAACIYAGIGGVSPYMTTASEDTILMRTGRFIRLDGAYLTDPERLRTGDILRRPGHTAVAAKDGVRAFKEYGPMSPKSYNRMYIGRWTVNNSAYLRSRPEIDRTNEIGIVMAGRRVACYGYHAVDSRGVVWLFVEAVVDGIEVCGWISRKVLISREDI